MRAAKTKGKPKLNANARKWVRALRSGKYKQAKLRLGQIDAKGVARFCCLGVACELFRKSGGKLAVKEIQLGLCLGLKYGGASTYLPGQVKTWLGLKSIDGAYGKNSLQSLACDNDEGRKFTTIAKTIESMPPNLFATRANQGDDL
jgi:hypothetical protein